LDIDDATAVAVGTAGISAWIPLARRAKVTSSDTVVALGATGAVGRLAVQVARTLGARRVVAVGRRADVLDRCLETGADAAVRIDASDDLGKAISRASEGSVDVVLDLLWGEPARATQDVCSPDARFVQVGSSAAPEALMPANPWRTRGVSILEYSTLTASRATKREALHTLLREVANNAIQVATESFALEETARAWAAVAAGPRSRILVDMA
jgi:NADPH:quinone reductase-like Zn-dependent oxidoreductase